MRTHLSLIISTCIHESLHSPLFTGNEKLLPLILRIVLLPFSQQILRRCHKGYIQENVIRWSLYMYDICAVMGLLMNSYHGLEFISICGLRLERWLNVQRVLTALLEDLSSVPSIHIRQLSAAYNFNSTGTKCSLLHSTATGAHMYTATQTHPGTHD